MSYDLIRLHHDPETGRSWFSFAENPARRVAFTFNLQPDNGLKMAIYKFRLALRNYLATNDNDYDLLVVESQQFGHLEVPQLTIVVANGRIKVLVEKTPDFLARKRRINQSIANQLVGLTLLTTHGNPLQTHARSSIKDVVEGSYCDISDFVSAFDWLQSESTALWLYFQTIQN